MAPQDVLLSIALDLTRAVGTEDRYRRLLEAVRTLIPCDAAALLRLDGGELTPVAIHGLAPETLGRRFALAEHPRLAVLCGGTSPVRFPPDSPLPDPYDGLIAEDPTATHHVHACLGCPLVVEGKVVGLLTADALDAHAFDSLDEPLLSWMSALAAAAVRTSWFIETLQEAARRSDRVARDVVQEAQARHGELVGESAAMKKLRWEIELVGRADLAVLVTGETGTGKELVARGLHAISARRDRPLLYVNCAALPESVAEAELFGHVRGSFTGADADRPGKFEVADGGTILLDEIGELPLTIQPKLLRVLQSGEIQRVGADRARHVDVRVIAATNRDLEQEIAAGRFRADLFHRLHVYPIHVPPLRDREGDVAPLVGHFCEMARRRLGLGPVRVDAASRAALSRYGWPGNVRELENVVFRSVLKAAAGVPRGDAVVVGLAHLGPEFGGAGLGDGAAYVTASAASAASAEPILPARIRTLREETDDFQRRLIARTAARHHGNWAAAARDLGLHRANLHRLAVRLGIPRGR